MVSPRGRLKTDVPKYTLPNPPIPTTKLRRDEYFQGTLFEVTASSLVRLLGVTQTHLCQCLLPTYLATNCTASRYRTTLESIVIPNASSECFLRRSVNFELSYRVGTDNLTPAPLCLYR